MEQRDSLERSSSENFAPQSIVNGSASNGGVEVPNSGQTTLVQPPNVSIDEASPVVDSVLQSDVCSPRE